MSHKESGHGLDGADWLFVMYLFNLAKPDLIPTWLWILGWVGFGASVLNTLLGDE